MGSIALEMQRNDLRLIPRWWLADFIQDYLHRSIGFTLEESKEQSDRVIRYLGGRTGLLEERGQGLFGFSHLTFQEYFASRGIIDENAGGSGHEVSGRLQDLSIPSTLERSRSPGVHAQLHSRTMHVSDSRHSGLTQTRSAGS